MATLRFSQYVEKFCERPKAVEEFGLELAQSAQIIALTPEFELRRLTW